VRWAAPEAIAEHRFTSKSDVWSFGVVLYEIFAFGKKPYEEWSNRRVIEELHKGSRLDQPPACPKEVYELMQQAWHADPVLRPNFAAMTLSLSTLTSTVEQAYQSAAISANKLVERFNAAKSALASTQNSDDYDNESVRKSPHGNKLYRRKKGNKSTTYEKASARQSHGRRRAISAVKAPSSKRAVTQVSYLALMGKNDKPIDARHAIKHVPPVYHGDQASPAETSGTTPTPVFFSSDSPLGVASFGNPESPLEIATEEPLERAGVMLEDVGSHDPSLPHPSSRDPSLPHPSSRDPSLRGPKRLTDLLHQSARNRSRLFLSSHT
jgi:serine/threonine protein kinase